MSVTVIVLLVLVVSYLLMPASRRRPSAKRRPPWAPGTAPERILADRLARGELDLPEYRRRLAEVRRSSTAGRRL